MTKTQPSGTQWTIQHGTQTAVLVEVGGGLRAYSAQGQDIVDGYSADEMCVGGAGQVLAPWPNRLRDGTFRFDGESHQLPLSEPRMHNAIHGLVRWMSWTAVSTSDSSVTLELDLPPQPGYPWRLLLQTTYALDDDGLTVTHSAQNLSDRAAPFGLGVHPYVGFDGIPVNDLYLTIPGRTRLLVDGRMLPIGAARVTGGEFDFLQPRRIGSSELDVAFGDVVHEADGRSAVVVSAVDGRSIRLWADSSFRWWQIYSSDTLSGERRRRSIAVEPMTCPPDALRSGRDLVIIQPGLSWHGEWGIKATS